MNVFDSITSIIIAILAFVAFAILIVAVSAVKISQLPPDNPLRRMLGSLSVRIGATVGVGIVGAPLQVLPFVDLLYDISGFLGLAWLWWTFARDVIKVLADKPLATLATPDIKQQAPAVSGRPPYAVRSLAERGDKAAPRLRG